MPDWDLECCSELSIQLQSYHLWAWLLEYVSFAWHMLGPWIARLCMSCLMPLASQATQAACDVNDFKILHNLFEYRAGFWFGLVPSVCSGHGGRT